MPPPAKSSLLSYHWLVAALMVAGGLASVFAYQAARRAELARAEANFAHAAALGHSVTREILGRYEDALFSLTVLFMRDTPVTSGEFAAAASRLDGRIGGVQAFEWVPVVPHADRAAVERAQPPLPGGGLFQFFELDAEERPRKAEDRPSYYPIVFVHPLPGNEAALGYDLLTGPTRQTLERARETRQMLVTPPIRLVQEKSDQIGVVLILPVDRLAGSGTGSPHSPHDTLAGFLQCVFRAPDLLETIYNRLPDTNLDLLFVDLSELDVTRRVLYQRRAGSRPEAATISEGEFRRGLTRELPLPFGQRDWRVVFRPSFGWLEQHMTPMPLVRASGVLLVSALLAGLVSLMGRRTATIKQQVEARTEELAESRRQLANMMHALPGMTYRCAYDGQLTALFVSGGTRELTGWTAEEFLSGAVHFRDCIHPADLERVREATRKALENQSDVEVEYRMRTKSGEEKWVLSRGRGVYKPNGELRVFEGLAIDITAQKNAESARLARERKLLEEQKFESLGLLAGGIAHDFNNLLSSILGNATLARLTLARDNAVDEPLRAIESASLRAAELCRQMLAYAGKGRFVIEPIDLTVLTEELLPLLNTSIAHQATLRLNLARNLPPVMADTAQIRQIVMNLVLNAADATVGQASEIVVSTGMATVDEATFSRCVAGTTLGRGEYIFLEVRDAGTGMSPDVLAKIFDPFFTTKFAGRGLGLAAVLGIVRGHHGALRVESTPGVGSSFRLFLPPARVVPSAPKSMEGGTAQAWPQTRHLLVIDDEEQVRAMMVAMLKVCGFKATAAAGGEAGLALFRADPDSFQLVVLDLLMPGMNGEETFRALRAIKADIRVLIVSGYSEGDILGRMGGGPALRFLAKPFSRAALEAKLRELLD